MDVFVSVFQGCHSHNLVKDLRKIALAGEGQDLGDLGRGIIGVDEHILGRDEFLGPDVTTDGYTGLFFEDPGQIVGIQSCQIGKIVYRDTGMQMIIDIVDALDNRS